MKLLHHSYSTNRVRPSGVPRVPDVVAHLGISRRLADKRFREYQGETILQTITRIRLDEVKRRLRETKIPIKAISSACGFPDANYLKVLFKRHVGMAMRDYRRGASCGQTTDERAFPRRSTVSTKQ